MKLKNRPLLLIISFILMTSLFSCSGSKSITTPESDNLVVIEENYHTPQNRGIVAIYDVFIDPDTLDLDLNPVEREAAGWHCALNRLYPNVLSIIGTGFDPEYNNSFYADIKLTHPFPGSGVDAFDPRIIALLPARDGVSMYYPVFNVLANNSALLNSDNYTKLFNHLADLPGNTNPYIAYFTEEPNRIWSSTGKTEETRRFYIDFTGFNGPANFVLVIDVSTAFPAQSQPVIDNTQEPVEISVEIISNTLTPSGGEAVVEVTFLDWQGHNNIRSKLECPGLYNLSVFVYYDRPGENPNEYVFKGSITNDFGSPPGDYNVLVAAWDIPENLHVFNEFTISVGHDPSAWNPDPNRHNVDLSDLGALYPPKPGSDLGVIDNDDPSIGGIVMYEEEDMVVKISLDLTHSQLHGYSYYPTDGDPNNPHPNPDVFPAGRIDAQSNGVVVQSWIDGHKGLGPDLAGQWQREDALLGIMAPDSSGWLQMVIGAFPDMSNDNPATPEYNESEERPRLTDVYEEYNSYLHQNFTVSGIWSGTKVWDIQTGNTYNPIGAMGGIKQPYFSDPFIVMDWGLWIYTGPPSNEIVAADASQDPYFPYQYWGFSGTMTGNALIGQYDKMGGTIAAFQPSNPDAKLLDLELIPLIDPPLDVNGIHQSMDWIAVLLDNQTVEVIDPSVPGGRTVDIIDVSNLIGEVAYLDIRNSTAEIFISHTDGITPYCTVLRLTE